MYPITMKKYGTMSSCFMPNTSSVNCLTVVGPMLTGAFANGWQPNFEPMFSYWPSVSFHVGSSSQSANTSETAIESGNRCGVILYNHW
uniref:Uncharacterized protein n=1 Tax=Globisporangium ultimum (strain ATCC 200006 / CBS 805.95 / DAOM BR144) TaxID=431595 RepID=K3WZL0_GLOUD